MAEKETVANAIVDQGLLPLYFHSDTEVSVSVLRALYEAGVRVVEYTNRGDAAFANFRQLVQVRNEEMRGMLLGVGTIKNLPDAARYLEAGADFLVSPGLVQDIAVFAAVNKFFYAPGCMTPSEIISAENAGVTFIKLFPGNLLGPEFMSGIREIFPGLKFMPTGGVDTTAESIGAWFRAGVSAVGMGSKLISRTVMDKRDFAGLTMQTSAVLELIRNIKTGKHGA